MNVVILSGRFGFGHNSVAEALREDLLKIDKNTKIKVIDFIEYLYPGIYELVYKTFNKMVNKYYDIYNVLYNLTEELEIDMKLKGNKSIKKISNLIDECQPDLIISTLPICAQSMSEYKHKTDTDIPIATCITDISVHIEWISPKTDYYLVPSKEIKENLVSRGVDKDTIYVVGVPVRKEFRTEIVEKERKVEKKLLIMGGGLGLLPNLDEILKKLNLVSNVKKVIITGNNKKAFKALNGKYVNTEVLGFTDKIFEYMVDADLIITKAGGVTLFEAIHTETPIFVITPFLAQEKLNAEFIEQRGIGKVIWDEDKAYEELIELLFDDKTFENMKINIRKIKEEVIIDDIDKSLEEMLKGDSGNHEN